MWKLKEIHRAGELAAAIAVVVSLIFVGLEVQQNSQVSIETATQRLLSEQRAVQRIISSNSDFACIYLRGTQDFHGMSGPDRVRLSAYLLSNFQTYQEMHVLMGRERIETEIWQSTDAILRESMQLKGVQEWFSTRRSWFGESFQQYIDSLIGQFPIERAVVYDDVGCPTNSESS